MRRAWRVAAGRAARGSGAWVDLPAVEAILAAARQSSNHDDFALVAMLGLLGLRIVEATSADIDDLGEEHDHRVLRVVGKGDKIVLVPLPPADGSHRPRRRRPRLRG